MAEPVQVLHVDDEADFVGTAKARLERESGRLQVETTTSPTEGLDRLAEGDVDCVISDYDMPELDGLEFLQAVRRAHPDLPFILLTGKGSEEVASEAISAGVTDYFQKRATAEQFQLLANRVIDAAEHRRSRTNYREIFEKTPDGLVVQDPGDGSFVDMNARYAALFGYTREEFLEAGFEAIHPEEPPYTTERAGEHVQRAIEAGAHTFEWPGVRKDGTRFWAEVHLAPVVLHGQDRVLASVRDVTERREYEAELERQNARLEEFTSIVSHDLRNPLSVAEGRLALARERYDGEDLDAVQRAHERMRRLIDDLLTLAREGEPVVEPEGVDLDEVVAECWDHVDTPDSELVTDTDQRLAADATRLAQLLENLMRNAVEHVDGSVTVAVGDLDDGFYLADDGPGIPPDDRGRAFESGFTTKPDGTGFGLNIVEQIADSHGWDVSLVRSEAGGARFEFTGVDRPE